MAASISMAGTSTIEAKSLSPVAMEIKLTIKAVLMKISVHISPNTKKARQLLKQATVLKNKLLMAGTLFQCTRAGANQNTALNGKYSKNANHMAS